MLHKIVESDLNDNTNSSTQMIKISKSRGGATASFPYDAKLVADIQQTFGDAKWSADAMCWTVPGDRAFERLTAWADSHNSAVAAGGSRPEASR